jgi:hypothetical protein
MSNACRVFQRNIIVAEILAITQTYRVPLRNAASELARPRKLARKRDRSQVREVHPFTRAERRFVDP